MKYNELTKSFYQRGIRQKIILLMCGLLIVLNMKRIRWIIFMVDSSISDGGFMRKRLKPLWTAVQREQLYNGHAYRRNGVDL